MRTVLLLPERLGVKRAGRGCDAGENRQGEKCRKDRLHDHLLSVCVLTVVTTASPTHYVARLARTERWRHAPVTNVDHFGIEPHSTSYLRAVSHVPKHARLRCEEPVEVSILRYAELHCGVFSRLIGKYQWRLVAVGAWCRREKKSGELSFE